jgi:hypothetical protein
MLAARTFLKMYGKERFWNLRKLSTKDMISAFWRHLAVLRLKCNRYHPLSILMQG